MYFSSKKQKSKKEYIKHNRFCGFFGIVWGKILGVVMISIKCNMEIRSENTLWAVKVLLVFVFFLTSCKQNELKNPHFDVIILGGGTGGVTAGIQAARMGAETLILEESPWLGGMLTAAGVSAIDGNHAMPAGLWGEFREGLYDHYGGPDSVATGWVSFTQFEPSIGVSILNDLVEREDSLTVLRETLIQFVRPSDEGWTISYVKDNEPQTVYAKLLIDGTDLGDIAAEVGVGFDVGMDARSETGETIAPNQANNIIQDLTYAAILQDYGPGTDHTIPRPTDYDSTQFLCACKKFCDDEKAHPCSTMLEYARLPNNKFMINWPIHGNDYYVNPVGLGFVERKEAYEKAKAHTLNFVYFIQKELGYKNLGIATDEFPSADGLPLMPYHREGRRIHGKSRLNLNHLLSPFDQPEKLYRTGIAVGDYPIDHHHDKNTDAPTFEFPSVPSFNVPIGTLIPKDVDNFLIADKAISVTNIVNGSSRLQPVIMQIGQAAGVIAAYCVKNETTPHQIPVRAIQTNLLEQSGYVMPYYDVNPRHPYFKAIQKVGATGILKGKGVPYKWANQTWFYPDSTLQIAEFTAGLVEWEPTFEYPFTHEQSVLLMNQAISLLYHLKQQLKIAGTTIDSKEAFFDWVDSNWTVWGLEGTFESDRPIKRGELAVLLDQIIDPFHLKAVNFQGELLSAQ